MNGSYNLIYLLPVIAAVIGWTTNYLAIKMLFHPREPKGFLGFTFHGVFPKKKAQIAEKLGELVANELFSMQDVTKKLKIFPQNPKF